MTQMTSPKAYLERIGYHGSLRPSVDVLRELHRRHLLSVPFENLDIETGRPIVLSQAAFYDKIIGRGRGGFCYELNGSFAGLLKELGFRVSILSARSAEEGGSFTPEFDHMALLIRLEDRWLVDVGFGDLFIEPKRLDVDGPQIDDGKSFRIAPIEGGRLLSRWDEKKNSWKPEYLFTLRQRKLEDFGPMCTYQQTSPDSYFRRGGFCSLLTPSGRVTVTEKKLIVTRAGRRFERPVRDTKEFRALLRRRFGIDLDRMDLSFRKERSERRTSPTPS
jgi:N-hydroxyarylamine O-acetyltransferase